MADGQNERPRSLSQIERAPQREPRIRRISSSVEPGEVTAITDMLFPKFSFTEEKPIPGDPAPAAQRPVQRDRTLNKNDFINQSKLHENPMDSSLSPNQEEQQQPTTQAPDRSGSSSNHPKLAGSRLSASKHSVGPQPADSSQRGLDPTEIDNDVARRQEETPAETDPKAGHKNSHLQEDRSTPIANHNNDLPNQAVAPGDSTPVGQPLEKKDQALENSATDQQQLNADQAQTNADDSSEVRPSSVKIGQEQLSSLDQRRDSLKQPEQEPIPERRSSQLDSQVPLPAEATSAGMHERRDQPLPNESSADQQQSTANPLPKNLEDDAQVRTSPVGVKEDEPSNSAMKPKREPSTQHDQGQLPEVELQKQADTVSSPRQSTPSDRSNDKNDQGLNNNSSANQQHLNSNPETAPNPDDVSKGRSAPFTSVQDEQPSPVSNQTLESSDQPRHLEPSNERSSPEQDPPQANSPSEAKPADLHSEKPNQFLNSNAFSNQQQVDSNPVDSDTSPSSAGTDQDRSPNPQLRDQELPPEPSPSNQERPTTVPTESNAPDQRFEKPDLFSNNNVFASQQQLDANPIQSNPAVDPKFSSSPNGMEQKPSTFATNYMQQRGQVLPPERNSSESELPSTISGESQPADQRVDTPGPLSNKTEFVSRQQADSNPVDSKVSSPSAGTRQETSPIQQRRDQELPPEHNSSKREHPSTTPAESKPTDQRVEDASANQQPDANPIQSNSEVDSKVSPSPVRMGQQERMTSTANNQQERDQGPLLEHNSVKQERPASVAPKSMPADQSTAERDRNSSGFANQQNPSTNPVVSNPEIQPTHHSSPFRSEQNERSTPARSPKQDGFGQRDQVPPPEHKFTEREPPTPEYQPTEPGHPASNSTDFFNQQHRNAGLDETRSGVDSEVTPRSSRAQQKQSSAPAPHLNQEFSNRPNHDQMSSDNQPGQEPPTSFADESGQPERVTRTHGADNEHQRTPNPMETRPDSSFEAKPVSSEVESEPRSTPATAHTQEPSNQSNSNLPEHELLKQERQAPGSFDSKTAEQTKAGQHFNSSDFDSGQQRPAKPLATNPETASKAWDSPFRRQAQEHSRPEMEQKQKFSHQNENQMPASPKQDHPAPSAGHPVRSGEDFKPNSGINSNDVAHQQQRDANPVAADAAPNSKVRPPLAKMVQEQRSTADNRQEQSSNRRDRDERYSSKPERPTPFVDDQIRPDPPMGNNDRTFNDNDMSSPTQFNAKPVDANPLENAPQDDVKDPSSQAAKEQEQRSAPFAPQSESSSKRPQKPEHDPAMSQEQPVPQSGIQTPADESHARLDRDFFETGSPTRDNVKPNVDTHPDVNPEDSSAAAANFDEPVRNDDQEKVKENRPLEPQEQDRPEPVPNEAATNNDNDETSEQQDRSWRSYFTRR